MAQNCKTYCERKVCALIWFGIFGGLLLFGIIVVPLFGPQYAYLQTLTVDDDFPLANNSLPTPGSCEVTVIWSRPVAHREACGKYCTHIVCYDDWIFECSYSGTPSSGPFVPSVDQLVYHESCEGGCNRWGGWAPVTDPSASSSAYTSSLVSGAWSKKRWIGECDAKGTTSDEQGVYNQRETPDWLHHGAVVQLRFPVGTIADVPPVYTCPGANYNPLCGRAGELVNRELASGQLYALRWLISGSVLFPCGLLLLLLYTRLMRRCTGELGDWVRRCFFPCSPCGDALHEPLGLLPSTQAHSAPSPPPANMLMASAFEVPLTAEGTPDVEAMARQKGGPPVATATAQPLGTQVAPVITSTQSNPKPLAGT